MLPITNHRVLHIPHSLAIGAAIVGLVVAMSWDRPEPASPDLMVGSTTAITLNHGEQAPESAAPTRERDEPKGREMLPGFGPLVLPLGPGRQ